MGTIGTTAGGTTSINNIITFNDAVVVVIIVVVINTWKTYSWGLRSVRQIVIGCIFEFGIHRSLLYCTLVVAVQFRCYGVMMLIETKVKSRVRKF